MSKKEMQNLGSLVNKDMKQKVEKDNEYYNRKIKESNSYKKEDGVKKEKVRKRMPIKDYIIFLLGRREYSTKEIETKLKNREHTPEEIKEAIEWAISNGYQSDKRFAISHAKSRAFKRGDRGLLYEMKTKGMNDEDIEAAMKGLDPELDRAIHALDKYASKDLNDPKIKEKAFRSLASKGFSFSSIKEAWSELIERNS